MPSAARTAATLRLARSAGLSCLAGIAMLALAPTAAARTGDAPGIDGAGSGNQQRADRQGAVVRTILADIRNGPVTDMNDRLTDVNNSLLRAYLSAEAVLADPGAVRDGDAISAILAAAPDLPQRPALERLARDRGFSLSVPPAPAVRPRRADPTPRRNPPRSSAEPAAVALAPAVAARIRDDDSHGAELLVRTALPSLSPDAAAEWLHKAAWAHYIENLDDDALRVAREAADRGGAWAVMATHVMGLVAWRAGRFGEAEAAFARVAVAGHDADLRSAGAYWASRAAHAAGRPARVTPYLRQAAVEPHSLYGLMARESLGLGPLAPRASHARSGGPVAPAFRDALAALVAGGADAQAGAWLRRRADSAADADHGAYRALAAQLNLPATQMQLAQSLPVGAPSAGADRFPVPRWRPEGGWSVDPSLVLAHAMQESAFRPGAVSPVGATGLMQLRPGTARDLQRWGAVDAGSPDRLADPGVSLSLGQAYLRRLAALPATEGRLAKVIAAYNAGPAPIGRWKDSVRYQNDPLLFIESIPYGETRQYVGTVLRNYWAYRAHGGSVAPSLKAIVQGQWSTLPGAGQELAEKDDRTRLSRN